MPIRRPAPAGSSERPAMISSARRHSSAVRASGPTASRVQATGTTPSLGTRPARRPVAGDPAERGRDPDRAGRVGAEREVDEAGGDGRAAAAARAARRALEIPRVAGRAEVRAVRERAERELVRVQLPDDRRAGRPQAGDALGVALGHAVEDLRRRRRRHARDVDHVLDGARASHPPSRPGGGTRCRGRASRLGLRRQALLDLGERRQDPVEEVADALEVLVGRVDALGGRRLPAAVRAG